MTRIKVKGLEVSARHGVLDAEKVTNQKFIFDAVLDVDFFSALSADDLQSTVDYSAVCAVLDEVATKNTFNLIEKLALECAFALFEKFPSVTAAEVTVYKPDAPMPHKFTHVAASVQLEKVNAYLSLGSSLGDRRGYLEKALSLLEATRGIEVKKISKTVETPPYGGVAENKFLNCAVCVSTILPPHALLDEIHRIEGECGRVRDRRWGDRTLDIDIIFYGDKIISDETLTVPHPEWEKRDFVTVPLKSIAPHLFRN